MPDTLSLAADVQLNAAPLTRYKDHYSVVIALYQTFVRIAIAKPKLFS